MTLPEISDHILNEWEVRMILRKEMESNELGKFEIINARMPTRCPKCKKQQECLLLKYQEYKDRRGKAYNLFRCLTCNREFKQPIRSRWLD